MTKSRPCDRKPCGEPGERKAGSEFLCADHYADWCRDGDGDGEFDEIGRHKITMRNARAM